MTTKKQSQYCALALFNTEQKRYQLFCFKPSALFSVANSFSLVLVLDSASFASFVKFPLWMWLRIKICSIEHIQDSWFSRPLIKSHQNNILCKNGPIVFTLIYEPELWILPMSKKWWASNLCVSISLSIVKTIFILAFQLLFTYIGLCFNCVDVFDCSRFYFSIRLRTTNLIGHLCHSFHLLHF